MVFTGKTAQYNARPSLLLIYSAIFALTSVAQNATGFLISHSKWSIMESLIALRMTILDLLYSQWIAEWWFCVMVLYFEKHVYNCTSKWASDYSNGVCPKRKMEPHSLTIFLDAVQLQLSFLFQHILYMPLLEEGIRFIGRANSSVLPLTVVDSCECLVKYSELSWCSRIR